MSLMANKVINRVYNSAEMAEDLPWNRQAPTLLLTEAAAARQTPGRALDIGCGSGLDSVFLASQGWSVTSLDFIPKALQMTRARADKAGVDLTIIEGDVTTLSLTDTFDLIVDAGCLHSIRSPERRKAYRQRLSQWLNKDGDYVLRHFERRHFWDWRPIGPYRVSRSKIKNQFAHILEEKEFVRRVIKGRSLMMKPTAAFTTYWFKRR